MPPNRPMLALGLRSSKETSHPLARHWCLRGERHNCAIIATQSAARLARQQRNRGRELKEIRGRESRSLHPTGNGFGTFAQLSARCFEFRHNRFSSAAPVHRRKRLPQFGQLGVERLCGGTVGA